jgi:MFS family permease
VSFIDSIMFTEPMAAESAYRFKENEKPPVPGSPAAPIQPSGRRHAYLLIGLLIGVTSGLGNALIAVNLAFVQGALALSPDEGGWLTGAYFMAYGSANLVIVRFRQQLGLTPFVQSTLIVYATATFAHLVLHSFWTAVFARAASGFAGAGLASLAIFYCMQGMTPAWKLAGITLGISVPQLGTPLARIISPWLLYQGDWRMGYWFEFGLVLLMFAAVWLVTLPPTIRTRPFERIDAISVGLLAPGVWLLVAVFAQGRILWWTDTPWLGWALAASVVLLAAGVIVEHGRTNPLIDMHFMGRRQMVRLMIGAICMRVLISEQAYGAVGFIGLFGLINDQMIWLNVTIVLASIAGLLTAIFTLNPTRVIRVVQIAAVLIAVGAWLDGHATNLTRPANFFVSQALIGFAALYFIGPAMLTGLSSVINAGSRQLASFLVFFNFSQSVGGLIGNTLLSTFQVVREKGHSHELVQTVMAQDPLVASRLQGVSGSLADRLGDTAVLHAEAIAKLGQDATREANVLAYNDTFLLVFGLAMLALVLATCTRVSMVRRHEKEPVAEFLEHVRASARQRAAAVKPAP